MDYRQILAVKMASSNLEYAVRAARIAQWAAHERDLSEENTDRLFNRLVELIIEEEDPFDEIALQIIDEWEREA
jgi:hypothetical protein